MTAPQEATAEPRNRLPLLVGVGLALGLVLFLGTKVLGGGGGDEVEAAALPSASTATTTATTAAPAAPEGPAPVETFEVFTTKNPFMPLRTSVVAPAASATAAPVSASAPAAAAAPAKGAVVVPVAVTPAPAVAATTAPAGAPVASQTTATGGQATEPVRRTTRVALLDVFAEGDRIVANVRVNDTVSKVGAGDTFASNFKVVSLDPAERCGRFLFGDDQFRLCRGEEILK